MLIRKMIRDIKKHKTQFISIFLMAFLGVFVFAGVGSESMGLDENVNQFYEDTNMADGWIYSFYLNDLFLEQVDLLGATTQMERQVVINSVADFGNHPDITLHFVENNTVSKFYLIEGEPLDINDSEGVWLDKNFADAKGLNVGDNITFEFEGFVIQKVIKGIGYSPEYVYHTSIYSVLPDFNKIGFAYLSYKAFPSDTVPYNVLNIKFEGTAEMYSELLAYRLDGYYTTFIENSQHSSVSLFSDQISLHKMMADVFPVVFILVSMLILLTTMARIITHQRTQIGVLKANGFKNRSIILHYLSYGFLLVLIGSVLGLILGPMILPSLLYSAMNFLFTLPSWKPAWNMNFVYVAGAMILMSLVVSYYSAKSIFDESPSEAIKPKKPKVSSSGFIERLGVWNKLSFNFRWNYRDAKRNKFRALMTIVGVMGCTTLLVCAFGLNDTMNDLIEWDFNIIDNYDSELTVDSQASQSEIDEVADEVNGDQIMKCLIEIESSSAKKTGMILSSNGTDLITPTDSNMNKIEIGVDEVSISQKIADILGVTVGDTIEWNIKGSDKKVVTKIDKIHADPNSQGIIISKQKLEELGLNFTTTSIVTADHVDKNYSIIKSVTTRESRTSDWHDLMLAAWILIYILIIFASILAVIVLYNLGLLSFIEIEREMATLKVLGFKTSALRRLLLTQNLWFTSIGFILGLPLGFYILKMMWNAAGDSYYVLPRLSLTTVILSGVITFSLSILVNWMFSRKIKNLDMVESLKGGE
ncbi:MAG: ABC transporter permease [Methanobrevibacter sp.]|nr:ABC transporter permease [Methanobrevibacter sp.]